MLAAFGVFFRSFALIAFAVALGVGGRSEPAVVIVNLLVGESQLRGESRGDVEFYAGVPVKHLYLRVIKHGFVLFDRVVAGLLTEETEIL